MATCVKGRMGMRCIARTILITLHQRSRRNEPHNTPLADRSDVACHHCAWHHGLECHAPSPTGTGTAYTSAAGRDTRAEGAEAESVLSEASSRSRTSRKALFDVEIGLKLLIVRIRLRLLRLGYLYRLRT